MWHFYKLNYNFLFSYSAQWVHCLFVYNQWAWWWCNNFHNLLKIVSSVWEDEGSRQGSDWDAKSGFSSLNIVVVLSLSLLQILPLQLAGSKYTLLCFSCRIIQRRFSFFQPRIFQPRLDGISKLSKWLNQDRLVWGLGRTVRLEAGLFSVFIISEDSLSQLAPRLYFVSRKTMDL